jgi:phospholipid N-methyltransferase
MVFFKKYFSSEDKRKQVGAVCPSSPFLARDMVVESEVKQSKVIIELWAGTWVFTERIFDFASNDTQIFVIEIEEIFFDKLSERFPDNTASLYHIDARRLPDILREKGISQIDLVISSLPFLSLPSEIFPEIMEWLWDFFHADTLYKQFSYLPKAALYKQYFSSITKKFCMRNIPPATVFSCRNYKKLKSS